MKRKRGRPPGRRVAQKLIEEAEENVELEEDEEEEEVKEPVVKKRKGRPPKSSRMMLKPVEGKVLSVKCIIADLCSQH